MDKDKLDKARLKLLDEIRAEARATKNFTGRAEYSDAVMQAMARVPRHEFVGPGNEASAYVNRPLPIGHGQTISQPYIVAVMTDLLDLQPGARVLEIGTGCGYQSAVLAEAGARVYTLETVRKLADSATARLKRLGYDTVQVRFGDGYEGWPEQAPFDAIIVTAAPETIPPALTRQLKPGGRIVIPVGPAYSTQFLKVGVKDSNGKMHYASTLPVAFVPMLGKHAGKVS